MLALLYQAARKEGCDISMCDWLEADSCPESFFGEKTLSCQKIPTTEDAILALYDGGKYPGWMVCCKLVRRELATAYPFTEGRIFEDSVVATRWICATPAIANVPQALYFYRVNPESVTRESFCIKKLDCLWALESMIDSFSDVGYCRMRQRVLSDYVDLAVHFSDMLREDLKLHSEAKQVVKSALRFVRTKRLRLSAKQKIRLWSAKYLWTRRKYCQAISAKKILTEQVFGALLQRIASKMHGRNKPSHS